MDAPLVAKLAQVAIDETWSALRWRRLEEVPAGRA